MDIGIRFSIHIMEERWPGKLQKIREFPVFVGKMALSDRQQEEKMQ